MSDNQNNHKAMSGHGLEMLMRDVIDSLFEFSLGAGFAPSDGGFEILEICPANHDKAGTRKNKGEKSRENAAGDILQFPDQRRAVG